MKRKSNLKDGRTINRYSDSFKRKVLEEVSQGLRTKNEVIRDYGIAPGSLYSWMKKFSKLDLYNPKVYIKMPYEKDKLKALRQELSELKEAMIQSQLNAFKAESDLEVALEMLGMDKVVFKKKRDAPHSKKRLKKAGR